LRLPVRSEGDAFRIAVVSAAVIGVCLLLGYLTDPGWGIGLFILAALGSLVWDVLRPEQPDGRMSLREAAEEGRRAGRGSGRILVIADETLGGATLHERLLAHGEPRPELRVVVPILLSRTHYLVSDSDREREDAGRRLEATLDWARREGVRAIGVVGDASDPLAAIADELRLFGAEEVIVAMHPPERRSWVESGILEHVRTELDIPVTEVVVEPERGLPDGTDSRPKH
jgi:hypothetical protein